MAYDNQASYMKIGVVILLGLAAILGTLFMVGGLGDQKHIMICETYSKKPVSGLSVGSPVNFRGVQVGRVKEILFVGNIYADAAEKDWQTILIRLAFDTRLFGLSDGELETESAEENLRRIREKGLHATVSSSGVTGLSRIELDFPQTPVEDEPISWTPVYPCIPPALSLLDSAADSATRVINQIDRMDLNAGWDNIERMTASAAKVAESVSRFDFAGVSANVLSVSESAKVAVEHMASVDIERVWTNVIATTEASAAFLQKLSALPLEGISSDVRQVTEEASGLVREAHGIIVEEKETLHRILGNLEEASASLRDLAAELRADPSRLIRPAESDRLPETAP